MGNNQHYNTEVSAEKSFWSANEKARVNPRAVKAG